MPTYSAVDIGMLPKRPHSLLKLEDDGAELRLSISADDGTEIYVTCDSYLLFMRRDESDAIRTVNPVVKHGAPIFMVEKSPLMAWFIDECAMPREEKELKHFIVACADDVIDIISLEDLSIEVSRENQKTAAGI